MNETFAFALKAFVALCIGISVAKGGHRLFACALLLCGVALAQVGSASVHGTVTDSSGAVLVGATVTIKNVQTGTARALKTDSLGRYSAPGLQVGEYQVQTQMPGFQTGLHRDLRLVVGEEHVVNVSLVVGQAESIMEVRTDIPQLDSTSSTISSLIDQRQMRDLPLNGRNFEQLILLAPGVQSVPSSGVGGALYGNTNDYSISGGRPVGQALILDGAPIQNFWDHGTGAPAIGTSLGVGAIAEFQVFTNTYGAEFGGERRRHQCGDEVWDEFLAWFRL